MSYGSCRRTFAISSMLAGSGPPLVPKSAAATSAASINTVTAHQTVALIRVVPWHIDVTPCEIEQSTVLGSYYRRTPAPDDVRDHGQRRDHEVSKNGRVDRRRSGIERRDQQRKSGIARRTGNGRCSARRGLRTAEQMPDGQREDRDDHDGECNVWSGIDHLTPDVDQHDDEQ